MLRFMPDAPDTNALLIRIAQGDKPALADLFALESARLIGIALRIVRRRDLAEEVVQETFVTAWRKAGQFDPAQGHGRAWLTTIARNRALNLLRDGSRMEYHDADVLADMGDRLGDAMAAFESLADRDALKHCLALLDEPRRRALLLCYVTGLNHGEAAASMNAPLGTVKAWIRRGTIALQECLS